MNEQSSPPGLARFARLTASALEVAIVEFESGKTTLCLDTLRSLYALFAEIAAESAGDHTGGRP
jgi:hypothetical protein